MKTGAIIQARMSSSRLPGKVLKLLSGKTVLEHVVARVSLSKMIDEIAVATSTNSADDPIEEVCKHNSILVYRGSEHDVLSRYYEAAKLFCLDDVVRITCDCPLIDPHVIDETVSFFKTNQYDLVSNCGLNESDNSYPRGLDIEVFSDAVLKKTFKFAREKYQREHVTVYMYEKLNSFVLSANINYSDYRLTLDTPEDFKLIQEIYKELYHGKHNFFLDDIINLFVRNPSLANINNFVKQKPFK